MAGTASILEVLIVGDATSLKTALAESSVATKEFQASQATAARSTSGLTSGMGKLGAAATIAYAAAATGAVLFAKQSVESAAAYNRAFTQIDALTNATTEQIGVMNDTVMNLAKETAQSPVELAHAMYFLASAGLDVSQQMTAIDAVARGMAIGLGDAGDLARITANALNVFGDNGLQAADVMDVLTAAIREGTAEPNEFADALGRVLPIADQAGISFAEVAASLATMSNAGLDVNEGVTALRAILQSLVAPTAQTEAAFAKVGVTVDQVVDSMGEQGLISTLRMLSDAAKENTDSTGEYNQTMRHIIPNIRGLAGALNLTHQQAMKVDEIFRQVAASTGDAAEAFRTTAQSDAFRIQKALNDISIAGQQLASAVLPAVATGLGFVADNADQLLGILIAFAGVKIVNTVMNAIAASSVAAAAGETALGAATVATTDALAAEGTVAMTTSQELMALQARNLAAAGSNAALAASSGMASGAMKLLNSSTASLLAGLYALSVAAQGAKEQVAAIGKGHPGEFFNATANAFNKTIGPFFTGGMKIPLIVDEGDIANFQAQQNQIQLALITSGLTAQEQAKVTSDALASVGGAVGTENVDEYAKAVQSATLQMQQQKEMADQLAASQQKAREETDRWQHSMTELTAPLYQLTNLGIDVNGFLDDFKKSIQDADDPMAAFEEGLQKIKQAAADWRTQVSGQLTGIDDVLSTLDEKAHLSTDSIHNAFMKAAQDAKDFADDLKVIGQTKGEVGRDLASSLLEGGLSNLAGFIAGQSAKTRRQLVSDYGAVLNAGDQGARTLQNVIAPVLRNIRDLLFSIARHFDPSLTLHDGDTGKKLDHHKKTLEQIDKGWTPNLFLRDGDTGRKLDTTKKTLEDIDKNWTPNLLLHTSGTEQLNSVASQLERLDGTHFQAFLDVHTQPRSPWPDEALKMHLTDPMKKMGFVKIGDRWTLPLDINLHSGPTTTIGAAVQKAFAVGNGLDIVRGEVGHDKTQKLLQEIKQDARKTGTLHLKALREIIAEARNPQRAREWAQEAMAAFQKRMDQADTPPAWIQTSGRDVPRLPRGVGRRNFADHRREINVKLDRKHYAESMTQEVSYGRGY